MRQAIILHSRYLNGGSCESVKLLIENIGHPVDLIVPEGGSDGYISKRQIKQFYGKNVDGVYSFFLPYSYECIEGADAFDLDYILRCSRLFERHKKELYSFLRNKQYGHIHLNSFGLYPVLNRSFPMTLHVREVLKGNVLERMGIYRCLRNARGFVFIDEATRMPFKGLKKRGILLANPVDQTGINQLSESEILDFYGFSKESVIFSVIGTLSDLKGQEFIIRSFNQFHGYPYKLLIVGDGDAQSKKRYTFLAESNPDIVFLGQLDKKKMLEIYRITDYIIRGEPFFAIGRTVYEGLYSGGSLMIQGNGTDIQNVRELEKFIKRIYTYLPRDEQSFLNVLHQINGQKAKKHYGETNAKEYGKAFNRWVSKLVC